MAVQTEDDCHIQFLMCMCVGMYRMCVSVPVGVCMCAHAHGGHWLILHIFSLSCEKGPLTESGAHQLGSVSWPVSPTHPPVFGPPVREHRAVPLNPTSYKDPNSYTASTISSTAYTPILCTTLIRSSTPKMPLLNET